MSDDAILWLAYFILTEDSISSNNQKFVEIHPTGLSFPELRQRTGPSPHTLTRCRFKVNGGVSLELCIF